MQYVRKIHAQASSPFFGGRGFTIIELVVVVGVTAILLIVLLTNLVGKRNKDDLQNTTRQIVALLREAQSRSAAQASSTVWGVHFANSTSVAPFYALFFSRYAATTTIGYYRLPPTVVYVTSTLAAGATLDITFSQITGLASASTSLTLYLMTTTQSSTVSVASSGVVTY